ncbi:PP2C family protein-serine/threonine phosphatase [Nocardioides daphniae]|uniref:Serine/threonine-protein phosphatase n=2 Tax=Nocardioides daphniae TaxID=402297 RepID=A0A4P7UD04_9ACTN|nr:PP2C family protein-serine/threonine phosphatase [Nocardioides daphniae]QCC76799.1 serine/threonine-protein phosphatase [Nocardioides daphniae]
MTEQASMLSAPFRTLRRRVQRSMRTGWSMELLALIVTAVGMAVLIVTFPSWAPLMMLVLPLAVGSLVLGPKELPWFVVFVLLVLALTTTQRADMNARSAVTVAVVFALGFIILLASFRRSRLGVAGVRGESMLVDLRDRILKQGTIPDLPDDWQVEWELRSAGGTLFAGDFVVASRASCGRLDLVVVDVSGKGEQAGTRALLLSGAFGGLMGALSPEEFLPAANDYLLRQEWVEGFASAVHLSLDLTTGRYEVRSAGHPPAALHDAGAGRWAVLDTEGPLLGLIPGAEFPVSTGTMRRGDAMLLYTDGLVETKGRDISMGIDRMLGQAERVLRGDFSNGAARLVDAVGGPDDDRGLLLLHRKLA